MILPLPCPFCGAPPEVEPEDPMEQGSAWARVACRNESCKAIVAVEFYGNGTSNRNKSMAIRRWNHRTEIKP